MGSSELPRHYVNRNVADTRMDDQMLVTSGKKRKRIRAHDVGGRQSLFLGRDGYKFDKKLVLALNP